MNRAKTTKVGLTVLVLLLLGAWGGIRWKIAVSASAYKTLLSGESKISRMVVSGQQRHIQIDDRKILGDLERAFANKNTNAPKTGLTYQIIITFDNGKRIATFIYLYVDMTGFAIADNSRVNAGDPTMVNVEFKNAVSEETVKLMEALLR